jgi:hypothetical protein
MRNATDTALGSTYIAEQKWEILRQVSRPTAFDHAET